MMDMGPPRRTGFYAGAFEAAARDGKPLYAVAFRRSETSTLEIFKLESAEEASGVMAALVRDGVALKDMWPVVLCIGTIDRVLIEARMPDVSAGNSVAELEGILRDAAPVIRGAIDETFSRSGHATGAVLAAELAARRLLALSGLTGNSAGNSGPDDDPKDV